MSIRLHLRCSGPPGENNGCPEELPGFIIDVSDSHEALKHGWEDLMEMARRAGWVRGRLDNQHRCPVCGSRTEDIFGIPSAKWDRAIDLYCSGHPIVEWQGRDGLPTRQQWGNAMNHYPELAERMKKSPLYKPRVKRGPLRENVWEQCIERLEAGETKEQICTGEDGWPTIKQWNDFRPANQWFADRCDAVYSRNKAERAAKAREARVAVAGPKLPKPPRGMRIDPLIKRQRAEMRSLLRAADQKEREEAKLRMRQEQQAEIDRWKREQAEERERKRAERQAERARVQAELAAERQAKKERAAKAREDARLAARAAKERERMAERQRRLEERQAKKIAEMQEKALRPKRPRGGFRPRVVEKLTPLEKWERRLTRPDENGHRFAKTSMPSHVPVTEHRVMNSERAALYFSGRELPKGYEIYRTCGCENCFEGSHLATRVKPPRPPKPRETIPQIILKSVLEEVGSHYQVPLEELTEGGTRSTPLVSEAKMVARYLLNVEYGYSQPMIADATNVDRTSVHHSLTTIEDRRDDEKFDQLLDVLADRAKSRTGDMTT